MKAFAEEYNQILQEREKHTQSSHSIGKRSEKDDSSIDDNTVQAYNYESDNLDQRFSRSLSSPLEHTRSRSVGRGENGERNNDENEVI